MNSLRQLTVIIQDLNQAVSFHDAARRLVQWARTFTGCESAILRLLEETGEGTWLAGCATDGASDSFVRDEIVVGGHECICGRVGTGAVDPVLPFYTENGSFVWGQMSAFEQDFSLDQTGPLRGRCLGERYESLAVFPLRGQGRVIGSLHLADTRPNRFLESTETVESVCNLAGDVLLRHKDLEREHAVLEAVQAALLPATPQSIKGLSLGVSFGSATELARLGGDFYDVLDLGDGGVLLLVGDAVGKGVEAVGTATRARYLMEAQAHLASDPASFMRATNESLLRLLPPERFVTAVACLLQPRTASITTCLAGHPSPLRLSSAKDSEIHAPHNPPLGVFEGLHFGEASEVLAIGDLLLIYTDGVSDSIRGAARFGSEGIVKICAQLRSEDPSDIARLVLAAANDYHDQSLPEDDRLVMVIRLDG